MDANTELDEVLPPEAIKRPETTGDKEALPTIDVRREVENVAGELLRDVSPETLEIFAARLSAILSPRVKAVIKQEMFSGPLPHPKHLKGYEDTTPGAADRILTMAEKAQSHLIDIQSRHLDLEYRDRRRGMWLGGILFALLVLCAAMFGVLDKPTLAAIFLGAAALSVVGLFTNGRRSEKSGTE
ncbi:DUF2335 domain-containing protein [Paracoccus sanguinis]|uniref:DUF2335 domain-containing protein n=1 Tax=Paracoccus sanguinis TaxID=1545044 RepID=UPI0012E03A2C|nr:DUF2335 domain-containing protein [Paracoccus sanguinis]